MSKRIVAVLVAVVAAAVGTGVLVAYVQGAEDRALAGQEVVDVLVVTGDIPQGTAVEDIGARVRSERIPAAVQATGSLENLDSVADRVSAVDLLPGEQVVAGRFITPEALRASGRVEVPDGLLQVTVSLSPERAVGGQLVPGDTAAVLASFDPFDIDGVAAPEDGAEDPDAPREPTGPSKTPNTSHLILHKVLVANVQVEQLPQTLEEGDVNGMSRAPDLAPTGNLLITLALDAPSVERVVFAAEHGRLWLSAEPEDAVEDGTRIQTRGTVYQ